MSINRKTVTKNAYRITKTRDKTCLRIRVPGGHLETRFFPLIQSIADDYGNGTVHLTTRQGFEVPDIDFDKMQDINAKIRPLIESLGLDMAIGENGYPAAGTRNISACIGNRVCPFANDDTTRVADNLEKAVYPHDFHFKIAVTGCPNDCIKAHMQDFGIICVTEPQYDPSRCITCEACSDNCRKKVTGALSVRDFNIERDHEKCIGCGECILKCPTGAWTRGDKKLYRMVIMGRTGKKNPRIAMPFLKWADEETITQVIQNTYRFVDNYIDRSLAKEHIGYIVDRMGFQVFKKEVLEGVVPNKEAQIAENITWGGYWYNQNLEFK
ncbi:sulfite reductase subunit C [Anaerotalea alkaliphila]|uniref:Sulfite reductase subunit C n=1 Tax=Anaerotalea alkaliphila TaxID=2662126 RepID=A0A7X5HTZ1_9FIRM|nr:sulfite reductase subunit C [Anaerotalea alkaliphila]NDL66613.1 sulfite reductase subunit C [Anaerotalea alkaliphila]